MRPGCLVASPLGRGVELTPWPGLALFLGMDLHEVDGFLLARIDAFCLEFGYE